MKLEDYPWLARFLWWGLLAFLAVSLYAVTFKGLWNAWSVQNFVAQDCVVLSKSVEQSSGNWKTYEARVRYRAASGNGGQTYSALSPYQTTGGWPEQQAIIDALPNPGEAVPCFVDPRDSSRAVLSKEISIVGVLLSLLPVLFAGLTFLGWRAYRRLDQEEKQPGG